MDRILDRDHRLIQAVFYILIAVVFGFGTFIMLERGYSSFEIGVFVAIADISGLLLNYIIAGILDNSEKIDVFRMIKIITIGMLTAAVMNYFLKEPCLLLSIVYIVIYCLTCCLEPLFNSLSSTISHCGINLDFGRARACGSLSYALTSVLFGYISEKFSYQGINISLLLSQLCVVLSVYLMAAHFYRSTASAKQKDTSASVSMKEYLLRHRNFILLVIGYAGIMVSTRIVTENFLPQVIYEAGGSNFDLGLLPGLKAIVEVPFIFYFAKLESKFGLKKIFIIAMISFILKMYVFYSADTMLWLYLSQLLQATSFSLIVPGMVFYVSRKMHKNELQRSHSLMQIIMTSFSLFISPLSGSLVENYGSKTLCLVCLIICFISAIVFMSSFLREDGKADQI